MAYKDMVAIRQSDFRNQNPELFENDLLPNQGHDYILTDGTNNIYPPIREEVLSYFRENMINWWSGRPVPHMNSSQIACINHLFAIKSDKKTILRIVNNSTGKNFIDLLPMACDRKPDYIAFEVISDGNFLEERAHRRGLGCTSVDAAIIAVDENSERWLIPIEWKYTESYGNSCNKTHTKDHYGPYIKQSKKLFPVEQSPEDIYFFEPFYELMRQTIWAEQMCLHKDTERLKCDHFIHLNVIPDENTGLLSFRYRLTGNGLEDSWRNQLISPESYIRISPSSLLGPIVQDEKWKALANYLRCRYW